MCVCGGGQGQPRGFAHGAHRDGDFVFDLSPAKGYPFPYPRSWTKVPLVLLKFVLINL